MCILNEDGIPYKTTEVRLFTVENRIADALTPLFEAHAQPNSSVWTSVHKNAGLGKNQRDTGSCLILGCGIRDLELDSAGLFKNPFMTCKISV